MSQPSKSGNKQYQIGKYSTVFHDETSQLVNNVTPLSLQSFVDDIPFQFNPKYQTILVPNIDIPEYDTTEIRHILTEPIDFTLENHVLLEALEDLKRKKKEIEEDTLRRQSLSISTSVTTNCDNSMSFSTNTHTETASFSVTVPPPPPTHLPTYHQTIDPSVNLPSFSAMTAPAPAPAITKPFSCPSYRLPSVRDIYWPADSQQHYLVPVSVPSSNTLTLPTPIYSTNSSTNSIKSNNQSSNNCDSAAANNLAATFDETLDFDDPFHDAELKSLNDVAELRHLYSTIGSANTVRR